MRLLTFDEFEKATEIVDEIITSTDLDIEQKIKAETETIPDDKKREFLNHLNSLFLNVLLNRLDELGNEAKSKSTQARDVISKII